MHTLIFAITKAFFIFSLFSTSLQARDNRDHDEDNSYQMIELDSGSTESDIFELMNASEPILKATLTKSQLISVLNALRECEESSYDECLSLVINAAQVSTVS